MGHTVLFWSPVSGLAGTSSNLAATVSMLGLEYSARLLLLCHSQSSFAPMEQSFYRMRQWHDEASIVTDNGVDAWLRLLQNRKLEPAIIRNYTLPLLKDRLDILSGSGKPDESFTQAAKPWLAPMFDMAKRVYDLVFVDGGSGISSEWTKELLRQADVLVICLPQNRLAVTRFFRLQELRAMLESKKHLIVFGQYDCRSAFTMKNLLRPYKRHRDAYPVSYNTRWMDDAQNGSAIDYMFRNRQVPRDHENHAFMRDVRALAQALVDQTGLNKPLFGGKEEQAP